MTFAFLPNKVTTPSNNFIADSTGYTQGFVIDNPAQNQLIRSGIIAAGATGIILGGIPISLTLNPQPSRNGSGISGATLQGQSITRATALANYKGFSTYNGSNSGIIGGGNTAPVFLPGMFINYVNAGSGNTIGVKCSSALAAQLSGVSQAQGTPVSWDYTNNELDVFNALGSPSQQIQFTPATVVDISGINSRIILVDGDGTISWTTGPVALIII